MSLTTFPALFGKATYLMVVDFKKKRSNVLFLYCLLVLTFVSTTAQVSPFVIVSTLENTKCRTPPQIPNGKVPNEHSVNKDGSVVAIACEEGFLRQVEYLSCERGEWRSGGTAFAEICTRESS